MHGDVVGVAVAAEGVKGEHDLGPQTTHQVGDLFGQHVRVGLDEGARMLVGRGAGHPRIAVAQQVHLGQPQDVCCAAELLLALAGQVVTITQVGGVTLSRLPHRGADEVHVHALGPVFCQRAAGAEGFVVGVGKDGK